MKSKKLFAILTLVAFMMTLVPMAAFANNFGGSGASTGATTIKTDKTTVSTSDATTERPIKITIDVKSSTNSYITSTYVYGLYVKSDNDTVMLGISRANRDSMDYRIAKPWFKDVEDTLARKMSTGKYIYKVNNLTCQDGAYLAAKTDSAGKITLYAYSWVGGTANLKFYNKGVSADDEVLIGQATLTFNAAASEVDDIDIRSYEHRKIADAVYAGDSVELIARVYDASNNGIAGKDVEYYVKKGVNGSFTKLATVATDDYGDATLDVSNTVADDYYYKVKCGSKTYAMTAGNLIRWQPASPVSLQANVATAYAEEDQVYSAKFLLKDAFGNKITSPRGQVRKVDFKITAKPAESGLEKDTAFLSANVDVDTTDDLIIGKFTPDVSGEYTVKATITGTGINDSMKVNVGEFGTIKEVKVQMPKVGNDYKVGVKSTTQAVGAVRATFADDQILRVKLYDENGLSKDAESGDVIISTDNQDLLRFYTGAGQYLWKTVYGPVNGSKGVATITVVHKDTGLSASLPINVMGGPASIKETTAVTDKVASINLQLLDSEGTITFDNAAAASDYNVYVDGVTVTDKKKFDSETGVASFTATAAEYGEKTFTVVLESGLTQSFKVAFGKPVASIEGAAKSVTMFIGNTGYMKDATAAATDVAPFIQNGRTFVAVRPLGDAFGAEIAWDEATQTVTLTRSDRVVTIVIGSGTITVVGNGVTSTVEADEPAFIKDGRTVLPFRAVGEAFGYQVSYDAATQSVSYSL